MTNRYFLIKLLKCFEDRFYMSLYCNFWGLLVLLFISLLFTILTSQVLHVYLLKLLADVRHVRATYTI